MGKGISCIPHGSFSLWSIIRPAFHDFTADSYHRLTPPARFHTTSLTGNFRMVSLHSGGFHQIQLVFEIVDYRPALILLLLAIVPELNTAFGAIVIQHIPAAVCADARWYECPPERGTFSLVFGYHTSYCCQLQA